MSYYRLFYHFTWATKGRSPLICEFNRSAIFGAIVAKAAHFDGIVHALNAMPDHVHLVVSVPPTVALSSFIGQVKGVSSHLAARLPNSPMQERFAWQEEYGVVSFYERDLPIVVRYVRMQQQHHASNKLNDRFERDA